MQSLGDEHPQWFYFLATVNRAIMNVVVQASLLQSMEYFFILHPGMIQLNYIEVLLLVLEETPLII